MPGLSDNIRVRSIVGRFLEHSRLYWFGNDGQDEVLLGSADLMTRNLDRRVEVLFPVQATAIRRHLRDTVLETCLQDNTKARLMQPDGSYLVARPAGDDSPVDAQARLLAGYRRPST